MREEITVSEKCLKKGFAAELASRLSKFESNVFLVLEVKNETETVVKRVNAKSFIGLLSLELKGGEEIVVFAEGDDQAAAVTEVKKLLA